MRRQVLLVTTTLVFLLCYANSEAADYKKKRDTMVDEQIISRGIEDAKVIAAMRKVERHVFVSFLMRHLAYADGPVSIGHGQTISQPYIVAFMTAVLGLNENDTVLEIGTGSGYQAAILAEIVKKVYTIEILEPLAKSARERLEKLGYKNIEVKCGDGYQGWPQYAPFDKIIVTAAPDHIPMELAAQLKVGGKMIIPLGTSYQELYLITKTGDGLLKERLFPVRFVSMVHGEE